MPNDTKTGPQALSKPEETPECESSTCHGISYPGPRETSDWPWRLALLAVAVMALMTAGFMVARIAYL